MTKIYVIAAAAVAIVLAFAAAPASARPCDDDRATCSQASSPMNLDQFMKTWKPAAVSKQKKKYRTSRATRRAAVHEAARRNAPARETQPEPKIAGAPAAETIAAPAPKTKVAAVEPTVETDGVAVTSFNEVNELDAQAARVQIVAFNEINEIDIAAPPPPAPKPAPRETMGQSISATPEPGDNSWIGKLLLAVAGTLALAGAARLLVA